MEKKIHGIFLLAAMLVFSIEVNADNIKNVAANNITYNSAEINWESTGDETEWSIRYKPVSEGANVSITLTVGNIWSDGSGYQMLLDADANAYGTIIPKSGSFTDSGDADESVYAEFEYKIPELADGSLTTTNVVVNNSVTISIPAGKYDWVITNPNPGKRIWIASGNGNVNGRQNDYFFEPGKHYEFTVSKALIGDQVNVTITDLEQEDEEGWTYVNNVSEKPVAITSLKENTIYMVQVQVSDGGEWTPYSYFTTLEANAMPSAVTVTDITSSSASLSWLARGAETKWNIRYRKNIGFYDYDFEDGLPDGWTTIDNDGDGNNWTFWTREGIDQAFWHSGSGCMMSESYKEGSDVSEELNPDNWLVSPQFELGGSLSFWARAAVPNYPDHFAVYLSTTSNGVDNFTIQILPEITSEGEYKNYTIDLSAYSGKGYIAFRHFNSADQYWLLIDDVTLTEPNAEVFRWNTMTTETNPIAIKGLSPATKYEVQVQAVYDDETTSDWTRTTTFITLEGSVEGDVSRDGTISIADVTALVNILLGKVTPENNPDNYDFDAANVNGDEGITIDDVMTLVNIILEKNP